MSVGETIRKIRRGLDMTQEELANRVSVAQSMIAQIERGSKMPTLTLACDIASALGCQITDLIPQTTSK